MQETPDEDQAKQGLLYSCLLALCRTGLAQAADDPKLEAVRDRISAMFESIEPENVT